MAISLTITGTNQTVVATNASPNVTFASGVATSWLVGATVQGTGWAVGTKIVSITGTPATSTAAVLSNNFTGTTGNSSVIVSSNNATVLVNVTSGTETPQSIINAGLGFTPAGTTKCIQIVGRMRIDYRIYDGATFDDTEWTYFLGLYTYLQVTETYTGTWRSGWVLNGSTYIKAKGATIYYQQARASQGGTNIGRNDGAPAGFPAKKLKLHWHDVAWIGMSGSNYAMTPSLYYGEWYQCGDIIFDYWGDSGANASFAGSYGSIEKLSMLKVIGGVGPGFDATTVTPIGKIEWFCIPNGDTSGNNPDIKLGTPSNVPVSGLAPIFYQTNTSLTFIGVNSGNSEIWDDYILPSNYPLITNSRNYSNGNRTYRRTVSFEIKDGAAANLAGVTVYIKSGSDELVNAVQAGDFSQKLRTIWVNWSTRSPASGSYISPRQSIDNRIHTAQFRKYGKQQQSVTYDLTNAAYSQPIFLLDEPALLAISDVTAAAITTAGIDWTAKTITPTSSLDFDQINARLDYEWALTANSAQVNPRTINGSSLTLISGWTLVVNAGITISEGNAIKKLIVPAITFDGTGTITGLYQIGTSPSARLVAADLSNSSLAVLDNTGATYDFASGLTGSRTVYFPPGKTGTFTGIAERLGFKRQTTTFTPGSGGDFTFAPIWIPDTSVIVTDPAVLSAYTTLSDQNKTLDRISYERSTSEGIPYDKAFKDGTYINWGNADVFFVASAADPLVYNPVTNKFTVAVGASRQPGNSMYGDRTTGHITADTGVSILSAYVDADGLRVLISGLDAQGFGAVWHLRYKLHTDTEWTVLYGTGSVTTILMTEALYDVQARVPGYDWKTTSIDTAKTQALDLLLNYQTTSSGTPQYSQAFDATREGAFSFDALTGTVAVNNTTGALIYPSFNDVYRAIQRIMHMEELVWTWSNPITYNSQAQKVIIPDGNPISMYLTEASTSSVILTCQVVHEATGSSAEDRVKGNTTGYFIKLGNQATADSASIAITIIGQLGGPNFVSGTHGLSVIKDTLGTVDTHVQAVAGNVWAQTTRTLTSAGASGATLAEIEASTVLAKANTAMTLTSAYDAAKTAATQTSVDTVKAKVDTLQNADLSGLATQGHALALSQQIGTPLQADDYEAPANADILSIRATVEAIEPTDLSGIPGAVRTELANELAHLDADVSSRSTLKPEDVPAGLTADDVWSHTERTLSVASGLTPSQQQALDDLQAAVADLLKAEDYTAPETAEAIAAQVELAILSDGDGRAILQAIADKIGNENLSADTVAAAVWAATGRSLSTPSGLTAAQLQKLDDLVTAVGALHNADLSGIPGAVRTELATELAHLDADISSRSTLTAEDIPAGLSAAEVLSAEVEPGVSVKGALRLNNAFVAGKVRGAGSNVEKFSNLAGTKEVIVSTNDAQGNRRDVRIDLAD